MADEFDEPHVPVKRDRFKRYLLPDPKTGVEMPWTRATTLARTLTDEYILNEWKRRQVVIGIGQRPDLAALAAATHRDDRARLDEIAERAEEVAGSSAGASLGRALHTFSQKLDGTGKMTGPSQYHPYLSRYAQALEQAGYGINPELIERIVICPEIKVAGQFDRLLVPNYPKSSTHVPERLVIGDLKTAKLESIKYAWLEIAIQLATYAHSTLMWDHTAGKYVAMPPVDLGKAIVMHLPQDLPPDKARCDLYEIDIVKGWECALLASQVRERRSASKSYAKPLIYLSKEAIAGALAEKVAEVADPWAGKCHTVIAGGKEVGCGKPHSGPGKICASCAVTLLPYLDGVGEVSIDKEAIAGAWAEKVAEIQAGPSPMERVQACTSKSELAGLWSEGTAAGWWTSELTAAGKARLAEL